MKSRKSRGKAYHPKEAVPPCPSCGRCRALAYQRDFSDRVTKWKCRDDGTIYNANHASTGSVAITGA